MPITLILAIIELIMKMPEIIDTIRKIIDAIHKRPMHHHGELIVKLHDIMMSQGTDKRAALEAFAVSLTAP